MVARRRRRRRRTRRRRFPFIVLFFTVPLPLPVSTGPLNFRLDPLANLITEKNLEKSEEEEEEEVRMQAEFLTQAMLPTNRILQYVQYECCPKSHNNCTEITLKNNHFLQFQQSKL